ncbi:hypothetical protein [Methylobacter sp.]|uniref:DUF6916 family protein n=1 Tax=Methylobacter sp. TaxID=2051955 RepID=UPI002489F46E|nr:hypothetical protein [Methylobacter sp.]MDI1277196.1 hypothetical protein [Methylobacter sp.]MDI1360048.1 hypothetical protein [Methylobacter sp.]
MNITLEQFAPLVGTNFTIHTQAGLIDLQLIEATELPRRNRPEQFRTPLSLIFTGPLDIALQQDTYLVEHPALGQHQWHLVPILSDNPASNLHYQILFG